MRDREIGLTVVTTGSCQSINALLDVMKRKVRLCGLPGNMATKLKKDIHFHQRNKLYLQ